MVISLCIYNHKGGVAKTSTAIHIASYAARKGIRTVLVDADAQGSSSKCLGFRSPPGFLKQALEGEELILQDTPLNPNLKILTSNIELATITKTVNLDQLEKLRLRLLQQFDFCVFDCSPAMTPLQVAILQGCDYFVVPLEPHFLALDGLVTLFKAIAQIQFSSIRSAMAAGIIFTKVHRSQLSADIQAVVKREFKNLVIEPSIPWSAQVDRAAFKGTDLYSLCPRSPVTYAYKAVSQEVLRRLGIKEAITV